MLFPLWARGFPIRRTIQPRALTDQKSTDTLTSVQLFHSRNSWDGVSSGLGHKTDLYGYGYILQLGFAVS